jgi:tetratricopeptide (TPR) repeat protein
VRKAVGLLLLALAACASPLERGEELYRAGDLRGALDTWRAVPETSSQHAAAAARLEDLAPQLEKLTRRYQQRGAWFEERGRLAEAILAYRLALELEPGDRETLARVQELSRTLATRKRAHRAAFKAAYDENALGAARREMATLRTLDPFDADHLAGEQALERAAGRAVRRSLSRGRHRFVAGDLEGAEQSFRDALAIEPRNESAQGYLAYIATLRDIEQKAGRTPGARIPPPALAASDAEVRAEGFYRNALAAEESGDPYTALRYDLAAVETDPDHREAREHMARLRARLAPRVDDLVEDGRIAFGREDLEGALERWRRALLIDPDHERARDWTERAEHLLANLERLRAEPDVGAGRP